jgi:hypothetical protein
VKDNGSASGTNIATLTPTVGESFESGVATYLLYTPFAYVIFIGNATTLKWRVLDSSYPDIPMNIPPTPPTPGTLGGVTGSLTNLTVSGLTSLGNSSNTGNLGVAGTTTLASVSATNINFTGGLYSNGVIFSGGSASPNFSTISTIGQAAFYSSVQIQGGLSVFSSLTARNINFTGLLTSNGTTFSGTPAGINSAGSIGIGAAAGATTLLVTGTQSNTGTLGVAGATTLSGTLGVTGLTTLVNSSNTGTLGVAGNATVTGTLAVTGGFTGRLINDSWIYSTDGVPRFLFYGSSSSVYRSFDRHDFRNSADTVIVNIDNAGNLTANGLMANGTFLVSLGGLYFQNNNNPGGAFAYSNGYNSTASINAAGYIVSSMGYMTQSDKRIKKNIKPATDSLDIINNLTFVTYDYIDEISHAPVKHGLIAQELQKVYPQAVNKNKGIIPSVMSIATYTQQDKNVIITSVLPTGFSVNDKVRLFINTDSNIDTADYIYDTNVLEIISDTQFIVAPWEKFELEKQMLIYGKEVDDLLAIDKPLIGILAARACQTLSGQVSTLQKESSQLSTITGQQVSTLQSEVQSQASTIAGLQATITTILEKYPV